MTSSDKAEDDKADFNHLYDQPDPRAYYQNLGALDYEIPQHAHPVFEAVRHAQHGRGRRPGSVLDVCCSYGTNAALLTRDLSLGDIHDRYADPALADLSPEQLAESDRVFFAGRRQSDAPRVLGLDIAPEAIAYARQVGLLDDGWAENLEEAAPSPSLAEAVREVDLITVTGGVGYVTEHTFARLMDTASEGTTPWVAAFVLRMYSYEAIADTLGNYGLVTEQLPGITFPQRRFATADEQAAAVRRVRERGLEPYGLEDEGWYHCDFFLSRPRAEVERQPIEDVVVGSVPR